MNIKGPVTYLNATSIVTCGIDELSSLGQAAANAPLRRARICLHASAESSVQEMIIAFCSDSYLRPHCHPSKHESFHLLDGDLSVALFDDDGAITQWIHMGHDSNTNVRLYRLNEPLWHTVVVRSEMAVIHEVTSGPFRGEDCRYAPWAPNPTKAAHVSEFVDHLRTAASRDLATRRR